MFSLPQSIMITRYYNESPFPTQSPFLTSHSRLCLSVAMALSLSALLVLKILMATSLVALAHSQLQKRQPRQGGYVELPAGLQLPGAPYLNTGGGKGGRTYIKYGRPAAQIGLSQSSTIDIGKESYMEAFNGISAPEVPLMAPTASRVAVGNPGFGRSGIISNTVTENIAEQSGTTYVQAPKTSPSISISTNVVPSPAAGVPAVTVGPVASVPAGGPSGSESMGPTYPLAGKGKPLYLSNSTEYIARLHEKHNQGDMMAQFNQQGSTYAQLGGGQFFQSLFGGKGGFSPLSFFLGGGNRGGGGGGGGGGAPFFIPVPIVVPPPPPPPPGPACYTNKSGFLCCNATLETTMEKAFTEFKSEGFSGCNVQKMASLASEKKFGTPFESIAAHKDFVAKINFAGDLNCKIEVDGKFILAYATPLPEKEVNIIDANSFFSGDASELIENGNGTDPDKPTYIVYGPIR